MSDQQSNQQQDAEIQAHNAVADALKNLNEAQTADNNRRQVIQAAQEQLDAAHAQLAEARTARATASTDEEDSLS
ncbi:hypothetical protein [Paenibacillus aceris]|uniref:Acyl-CoA reductase-like NAD-dependent aldehyde dehydrogenase n=1 Tax=Paenibacillus aceris TaxID=869555 RepID=A0ABS4I0D4_9BACL|nr:hypothetical protein [Paenibacillus aceris]MBP1964381.1 acyl-CoA reductase-like NAD-dependent aldehyde dehydrogenase [Paenibacillus aceris]NHW35903.1 hypothetical protein [Paenibacillus aceris]